MDIKELLNMFKNSKIIFKVENKDLVYYIKNEILYKTYNYNFDSSIKVDNIDYILQNNLIKISEFIIDQHETIKLILKYGYIL